MLSIGIAFHDDVEAVFERIPVGASTGRANPEVRPEGDDSCSGFTGQVTCRVTGAVVDDEYRVTVTPR